ADRVPPRARFDSGRVRRKSQVTPPHGRFWRRSGTLFFAVPRLYSTLADGPALTNGSLSSSPDGKRVAAVGVPGSANASIWVVEPDSSEPFRKLIEFPGEVRPRGITWTSDGSSLVVGRQEALSDLLFFDPPECPGITGD